MTRKRRPVHFRLFTMPGGAVYAATPERKPYAKKDKRPAKTSDPDLVAEEHETTIDDYQTFPTEAKQRAFPVFANRINTRRAIRELVLPELAAITETLQRIEERLDRIENPVGECNG